MKLRFTDRARIHFDFQIDYLLERGAVAAANKLRVKTEGYLKKFLLRFPKTGTFIPERDLWEQWIPRTKLVIWYRFTDQELVIIDVWYSSQDRQGAE